MNYAQKLVVQYIPLANKLACKKKKNLPKFIDVEDLKSAAYLGLVEAANRFDPNIGVAFSTFAYPRIWGSICDHIRSQTVGKKFKSSISLDESFYGNDSCILKDVICAKKQSNIDENLEVICLNFDEQAKKIMKYYFIEYYSMKEIGQKLGLSEGRICQLIKNYKLNIKNNWSRQDMYEELVA